MIVELRVVFHGIDQFVEILFKVIFFKDSYEEIGVRDATERL